MGVVLALMSKAMRYELSAVDEADFTVLSTTAEQVTALSQQNYSQVRDSPFWRER